MNTVRGWKFFTYGGMSMREIGALAVGIREMVDEALVGREVEQISYLTEALKREGIPAILPLDGLG